METLEAPTILITGFGPFGEHQTNASWEAVKFLPENIQNYRLIKQEIPVSYKDVEKRVPELWKLHKPQLVIHVGVSKFASKLTIESCANREGYQRNDVFNKCVKSQCCCEDGENCLKTELNVTKICDELNQSGIIKSCVSTNAGRYLCEFIYYTSLRINKARTLFIHVPPIDNPYSLKQLSDGLKALIETILLEI